MISVVVLTHNDEMIISRCFEGIRWCDEVIVIDDHSKDGTVAVAKKFGAKVFTRSLHDDFSGQRNFGLSKAKNDWVLFVDSDEVVSEKLKKEIQEKMDSRVPFQGKRGDDPSSLKLQGEREQVGYSIKRKDYWGGRWLTHGETAHVRLLRLARKNAGTWEQPVHEVWRVEGAVGNLGAPLLHYPHQNVAQFLEEINRYSGVYARHLHSRGVNEPIWQIVAKPASKFFVNYVWRLGFLDGTAGMAHALMMSFHSFLVRGKLWQLRDARKSKHI